MLKSNLVELLTKIKVSIDRWLKFPRLRHGLVYQVLGCEAKSPVWKRNYLDEMNIQSHLANPFGRASALLTPLSEYLQNWTSIYDAPQQYTT